MTDTTGGTATTLGEKLSAGRKEHGLTIVEAAQRLEVATADLAAWEANEARPSVDRIAKAAFVYGLDFVDLLTADRVAA